MMWLRTIHASRERPCHLLDLDVEVGCPFASWPLWPWAAPLAAPLAPPFVQLTCQRTASSPPSGMFPSERPLCPQWLALEPSLPAKNRSWNTQVDWNQEVQIGSANAATEFSLEFHLDAGSQPAHVVWNRQHWKGTKGTSFFIAIKQPWFLPLPCPCQRLPHGSVGWSSASWPSAPAWHHPFTYANLKFLCFKHSLQGQESSTGLCETLKNHKLLVVDVDLNQELQHTRPFSVNRDWLGTKIAQKNHWNWGISRISMGFPGISWGFPGISSTKSHLNEVLSSSHR